MTPTQDDLEREWIACIERYRSNVQAKAALLAATGAKFPWTIAEENRAAGLAALKKLLTGDSKAKVAASLPKKNIGERLNEMAAAIYVPKKG